MKMKKLIVSAMVLGLLVSGCGVGEVGNHGEVDAFYISQQFVTKKLKAPSTAKFPWRSESTVKDLGNNRYEVISYVDAQNSFGAMLRMHYKCTVEYVSGDNWKLISLEIN